MKKHLNKILEIVTTVSKIGTIVLKGTRLFMIVMIASDSDTEIIKACHAELDTLDAQIDQIF